MYYITILSMCCQAKNSPYFYGGGLAVHPKYRSITDLLGNYLRSSHYFPYLVDLGFHGISAMYWLILKEIEHVYNITHCYCPVKGQKTRKKKKLIPFFIYFSKTT